MSDNQTGKLLALEVLLRQANERAGNLAVELAAMTQERDELRREVEQLRREVRELARLASIECYLDECCPKQKALRPSNPNVCVDCTIEDAREAIKPEQAGKEGDR